METICLPVTCVSLIFMSRSEKFSLSRTNPIGSSNQPFKSELSCGADSRLSSDRWRASLSPSLFVILALLTSSVFGQTETKVAPKKVTPLPALTFQRSPSWFGSYEPLTPQVVLLLRFNAPIDVDTAAPFITFYDKKSDRRIPAEVKRSTIEESKKLQQFADEKPVLPIERFLTVAPVTPLPVGAEWRLEVRKGLDSSDRKNAVNKTRSEYLGSLTPFTIREIATKTPYDEARFIAIRTAKRSLLKSFTPELVGDYVSVSPQPKNFSIDLNSYQIQLNGDFDYKTEYTVKVKSGLIAYDRTILEEAMEQKIVFVPNPGFISLPTERSTQNAAGNREFQIMTGNLNGIRLRVKQLDAKELIYALRGYDAAYRSDGERKRAIPYEMVPGQTIHEESYKRKAELDSSEKIKFNWDQVTNEAEHGAFYLCAEGNSATRSGFTVGGQSLVQLTDIGLAWKQDGDETLFYAFSLKTGSPIDGVEIDLVTNDAKSQQSGKTDAAGIVRIETGTLDEAQVKWLDARRGSDRHVMKFRKRMPTMGLYGFSIPYHHYGGQPERRTLIFADRPVYKPGETVYFKVISRGIDGDLVLPPDPIQAKLKILDVRSRVILDETISLSVNGTYDGSFTLPKTGLGYSSIQLDFNQTKKRNWRNIFGQSVRVADYRPNTFEVDLKTEKTYALGEAISVPVEARYYMGKPLSKAKLSWHVSASRLWKTPKGFENFEFFNRRNYPPSFNQSEEIHLSEKGDAQIRIELPKEQTSPMPVKVSLSTEITDINQQTISDAKQFIAHSSDFYLGVQKPKQMFRVGQKIPMSFVAVKAEGGLHTDLVEATLKIEKRTWNTVKVKGAGGRISVKNEEQLIATQEEIFTVETKPAIDDSDIATSTIREVTLDEPGDFIVTVSAKDAEGRDVVTSDEIRIIGANEPNWAWRQMQRVDLLPDKSSYKVGETARLLLRSPVKGHALITTERAGVRRTFTQEITSPETVIELPVKDGDAPNIFASVFLVRGSEDSPHKHPEASYRVGYCQLAVDDPTTILDIAIQHKKDGKEQYYLPGEPIEVAALITNNDGQVVPNTEVTLYAVDEGVLSLTGYETPNPASTFNQPFPLTVRTGQSLSELLSENENELGFHNKGYVIGGGGEVAGANPKQVRKDFKALAFWEGALTTGKDGKVKANFVAPDNLTTFRIMAVAAKGNQLGSAESDATINKPLIIEPALPAFSNVSDQIDLTAVLHNNTTRDLDLNLEVTLDEHAMFLADAPGLMPTKLAGRDLDSRQIKRTFTIGAGKSERLSFPTVFTKTGEAKWMWKATAADDDQLTDVTESKLKIGYPIPILRETTHLSLSEKFPKTNALADINPRLLNGDGKITVSISNSRILEATDALDYLLKYPYGCVEQTSSSTLPWLSTKNMRGAIPALKKTDAEIEEAIQAGADRLLTMQTSNGGLGYWPGANKPILWGSAYGGMVLALAQKSGAKLPEDRLNKLWKYLSSELRNTAKIDNAYDLSQRCLASYTLAIAGASEDSYLNLLFEKQEKLPVEARSLLALAMQESASGDPEKAESKVLANRVPTLLTEIPDSPDSGVRWYRKSYGVATQLMAWSKFDVENANTETTIQKLLALRREGPRGWGSTYANAWPLLALATHTEANGTALANAKCIITFGDQKREVTFSKDPASKEFVFDFDGDQRDTALTITMKDKAKLFAHVDITSQPKIMAFNAENHGFTINRTYQEIQTDGSLSEATDLMVGDLVLVTLNMNLPEKTENYLAIDDPLPSIFEAVNPDFKTASAQKAPYGNGEWRRLHTHHKELRTDRALFFADYVYSEGDYSLQYLARVVASGEVTAPPAKIEAMYEPSRYGLSATKRISAKPLNLDPDKLAAQ